MQNQHFQISLSMKRLREVPSRSRTGSNVGLSGAKLRRGYGGLKNKGCHGYLPFDEVKGSCVLLIALYEGITTAIN